MKVSPRKRTRGHQIIDPSNGLFEETELSQGAKASRSGKYFENQLEGGFKAYGVRCVNDHDEFHYEPQLYPRTDTLLIRQYECKRTGKRIDYLYKNFGTGLTVPIECKNQMGGGTTDEKLSHTVRMLSRTGYPFFWLVINGDGWNVNVIREIYKQIVELNGICCGRLIHNKGDFLQRAIERLCTKAKAMPDG